MNVSRRSVLTWGGLTALALGGGVGSSLYWNSSDAAKVRNIVAGNLDISKGEKTIYLNEGALGNPTFEEISWNRYRKFNGTIPEAFNPFYENVIVWMTDFIVDNYGDNMTANLIPKFEVSDWMKSVGFENYNMNYYLLNKVERKDSFEFGFGQMKKDPNANDEEINYPDDYVNVFVDLSKGENPDPSEDSLNFASSIPDENKFEINPYFKKDSDNEIIANDDGSIEFKKGKTEFTLVARLNIDKYYDDSIDINDYYDFYRKYRNDKNIAKPKVFDLGSVELDYKQVEKP